MDNGNPDVGEWLIPVVGLSNRRQTIHASTNPDHDYVDHIHRNYSQIQIRRLVENVNDDNDEIIELLKARLDLGRERYGHGIRVHDDTRTWGTPADSWAEMGLEEALDLCLYLSAAIVRIRHADLHSHTCEPIKTVGRIGRLFAWLKNRS